MNKHPLIRKIYLYLFTLIGLALVTIGGVMLIGLGLRTYVFTEADNIYSYPAPKMIAPAPATDGSKTGTYEQPSQTEIDAYNQSQKTSQRQRDAAQALAMIIIGVPLYLYYWGVIKKDKEDN